MRLVKSQDPNSKSQPLPTAKSQSGLQPADEARWEWGVGSWELGLGVGIWEWLGFGAWSLGFDYVEHLPQPQPPPRQAYRPHQARDAPAVVRGGGGAADLRARQRTAHGRRRACRGDRRGLQRPRGSLRAAARRL